MNSSNRENENLSITRLRRAGDSVMLSVPPSILEYLGLAAGSEVRVSVEGGRMIVTPGHQSRYDLDALLAQLDADIEWDEEGRLWIDAAPMGREML